jgi:hypothetical protein
MIGAATIGLFVLLCWVIGMLAMAAREYRGMQELDRTWFDRQRESQSKHGTEEAHDGGAL